MKRSGSNVAYTIRYHHLVKSEDIPRLDSTVKTRIGKAIETRLMIAPEEYGEPLRRTLKGYWKLRVGDYRVVFKVEGDQITVLGIRHRKEICGIVTKERADR
jgi:mRNA interferase RelE/StbE